MPTINNVISDIIEKYSSFEKYSRKISFAPVISQKDLPEITEETRRILAERIAPHIIENSYDASEKNQIEIIIKSYTEQRGRVLQRDFQILEFKDNGPGTDNPEKLIALGESTKGNCRGVGMSIVETYVFCLGGKLELESKKRMGFTARIVLPYEISIEREILKAKYDYDF